MGSGTDLALIDGFIRRHYRWPGALRLHRNAIGWDLLRAPANVALAPLLLVLRLVSLLAHLLGFRRFARFTASVRPHFRSNVGTALEEELVADMISRRDQGNRTDQGTVRLFVRDYVAVRSAISEITAALVVLAVGLSVYHSITPGVISLAPVVTEHAVHARKVAEFPLGQWIGGAWYSVFPGERPVWETVAVGAGIVLAISLAATFAGVLADPIQARLGIHRRRLHRLLQRIDKAETDRPRIEGEFVLARGADLVDLATLLLRLFRS